jgi:hypothetical protein
MSKTVQFVITAIAMIAACWLSSSFDEKMRQGIVTSDLRVMFDNGVVSDIDLSNYDKSAITYVTAGSPIVLPVHDGKYLGHYTRDQKICIGLWVFTILSFVILFFRLCASSGGSSSSSSSFLDDIGDIFD